MVDSVISGAFWAHLAQLVVEIEVRQVAGAHDAGHSIVVRLLGRAILDVGVGLFVLVVFVQPLVVRFASIYQIRAAETSLIGSIGRFEETTMKVDIESVRRCAGVALEIIIAEVGAIGASDTRLVVVEFDTSPALLGIVEFLQAISHLDNPESIVVFDQPVRIGQVGIHLRRGRAGMGCLIVIGARLADFSLDIVVESGI